jgi:cardiolipin synthase
MLAVLDDVLAVLATALVLVLSVVASVHAVLHKREVHASISWAALIWLVPVVGAAAYWLLGMNRIRRRAAELRGGEPKVRSLPLVTPLAPEDLPLLIEGGPQLEELARLMDDASARPLRPGNRIVPLVDGDAAYPAMLAAIDGAVRSVALSTYIFDSSPIGRRFVAALAAAQARGVQVRVLLDDVGARYSWPQADRLLAPHGLKVARFLPLWRAPYYNLRNHRKLLVVDGKHGFTGGMNIRVHHVLAERSSYPTRDLAFAVEGPVVAQLAEVFAEDWAFTTGESLSGPDWFPPLPASGTVAARGIPDGPDEDMDRIRWTFLGGLSCARRSVRVLTPYFLPESAIATAFNLAAMRGVQVDIALPERGNLPLVQWAMWGDFRKVLEHGCRVWLTPRPFDHSKLMVVDDLWVVFGSPNWDPRSLRLNFELGVECYDPALATRMGELFDERVASARRLEIQDLDRRPWPLQIRDGVARLFTPYL